MNNLDKQYTDLLGDAYKRYADSHNTFIGGFVHVTPMTHSKESFIEAIKTDDEFAKKWGVKVEIRELRRRERSIYYYLHILNEWYNGRNLPKRAISITYNNQTIEIYE